MRRWTLRRPVPSIVLLALLGLSGACSDSESDPVTPPPDPPAPEFEQGAGIWESFPDLKLPLDRFGAAAYAGSIYIVGGVTQVGAAEVLQDAVYVFDWQKNTWDSLTAFPVPIADHAAAVVADTLYVVGGFVAGGNQLSSLWAYQPETDTWDSRPPMPSTRLDAFAVSSGGRLLVVGGFDAIDGNMLAYTPGAGTWTLENGPSVRLEAGLTEIGGVVYQTGGRTWNGNTAGLTAAAEVFALDNGIWSQLATHPRPRTTPATAALGQRIHFLGGQNTALAIQDLHMAWEPSTDRWFEYPDLPAARSRARAVTLEGRLYVIGGRERGAVSDRVDLFLPQ